MSKLQQTLLLSIAIGVLSPIIHAQEPIRLQPGDVPIKDVSIIVQRTPEFQAGNVTDKRIERPREWLELEVEFEVKPKQRVEKNAVLDREVTIRYYAGFKNASKNDEPIVLVGEAKHINVLVGEKVYSAAYIPPSTVGKMTGNYRSSDDGAVVAHGVEILYNGQVVGLWASDGKRTDPFWRKLPSQGSAILSRDKTPFNLLWIDRYPESKSQ